MLKYHWIGLKNATMRCLCGILPKEGINMNEKNKDYSVINVSDILWRLWQHKFWIIGFMLIGMVLMFVKVKFFTVDTYTANGVLYVSSQSNREELTGISSAAITSSRDLSKTAIETLKTRSFLSEVSKATGDKYSWTQIKGMMSVSVVNGTELLSVKVTALNPQDAYDIANSIILKAPHKLRSVLKAGEFSIVDNVIKPKSPNGKGLSRMVMTGALIGGVMAVILIFLVNFFDTKVRKSEDITKRYGVSVLGELAE